MQIRDTSSTFGFTSILLHWISAILIAVLFISGEIMEDMSRGPDKADLADIHQSLGMLMLLVVLARLVWRISQGFPDPVDSDQTLMNRFSRLWHWALLLLVLAIPLSGYLTADTGLRGLTFFNMVTPPDLLGADRDIHKFFEEVHETLSKLILPLVALHVLGALKHHIFDGDMTLKRMIGAGSKV
jgi:cytochrome b561